MTPDYPTMQDIELRARHLRSEWLKSLFGKRR